jgi:hypothetical protein
MYAGCMSKEEIIEALGGLSPGDRAEIRDEILRLNGLLAPSPEVIELLKQEEQKFEVDQDYGEPWEDVVAELRARAVRVRE